MLALALVVSRARRRAPWGAEEPTSSAAPPPTGLAPPPATEPAVIEGEVTAAGRPAAGAAVTLTPVPEGDTEPAGLPAGNSAPPDDGGRLFFPGPRGRHIAGAPRRGWAPGPPPRVTAGGRAP